MPHGQCDQDNVLYSLSLAGSLLSLDLPFTYEYTKWCKMAKCLIPLNAL